MEPTRGEKDYSAGRVDRVGSGEGRRGSPTLSVLGTASRSAAAHYLSFPSACTHSVKGDSYPKTCTQRNSEDGGFLLSGLARRAAAGFFGFGYCTGVVCILLRSERQNESKNKKIKNCAGGD